MMEQNDLSSTKVVWLKELFDQYGDYELFCIREGKPFWKTWKSYSECTETEKQEANVRSVFKQEIVLDVEDPQRIDVILGELKTIPVNYVCFATGSRGYHVHMIFPELEKIEATQVTLLKEQAIRHFGCDVSKKAERNLIALEYEPHFKTGKIKSLDEVVSSYVYNDFNLFLAMTVKLKQLRDSDPKFNDVFEGQWVKWGFPTRSEAEMSLCSILAIAGFSQEEILAIMQNSKVGKWHEKPNSYKLMTVQKAIELAKAFPKTVEEVLKEPMFRFYEEYGVPQPVSWLVPKYIPSRGVTILGGAPGSGKSFITEEMICSILNGRGLFNHFEIVHNRPVILIDMENDHSTLYERLQKLGGIPENMLLVFNFSYNFDIMGDAYTSQLREQMELLNPCLVIFDTLRRTFSGDENDSKVINFIYRSVLHPLAQKTCVLVLAHKRKTSQYMKGNEDDLSEIRGTGDLAGLASAVIMIKKNIDDTITVIPKKLRPAKLAEQFTVKIRDDGGKFVFEYLGEEQGMSSEAEQLADKLLAWLQHNKKAHEIVKTKEMVDAMAKDGHDRRGVSTAVAILRNRGILPKEKHGVYKFIWGDDSLANFNSPRDQYSFRERED